MVAKYPSFKDKPNHFRVDTKYESIQMQKDWAKEFPLNLITGRLVTHNGQGIESRISPALSEIYPAMFIEIPPDRALKLGIKDGDMVWVHLT
jgi:formate dehydrogenase major subunit